MSRMNCKPATFEITFGHDGKDLAKHTENAIEYFLNNLDYETEVGVIKSGENYVGRNEVLDLSRMLYELKTASTTGCTPRFTAKLSEIYLLSDIMLKYADANNSHAHRAMMLYFRDMAKKMAEVKW